MAAAHLGLALHLLTQGPLTGSYPWILCAFLGLAALALAACFLAPRWRVRLLLVLLLLTGGTFASEMLEARATLVRLPKDYDRRSKLEVVLELRGRGVPAEPSIPCDATQVLSLRDRPVLPLAGISNTVTVHDNDNETGQYKVFDSDRHGFNNPDEVWDQGPLDLALIGDSFTFGAATLGQRSFADQIRAVHSACLNLGIPGAGPLRELAILREYLPALEPRRVLWFFYDGNDCQDLDVSARQPILMEYLNEGHVQHLRDIQADLDAALRARVESMIGPSDSVPLTRARLNDQYRSLRSRLSLSALERRQRIASARSRRPPPRPIPFQESLFERVMEAAQRSVRSWGGELAFVYLPGHGTLASQDPHPRKAEVLACIARLGIEVLDLEAAFRAHPDPLSLFPFRRHGHYADGGNDLVAREVLEFLARRQ